MPVEPHPITITAYQDDNTTLLSGGTALVRNVTKRTTSAEATTNANGVAVIDLANLEIADDQTVEYEDGDKILIIVYSGNQSAGALYTVTGDDKDQSLYLTQIPFNDGTAGKNPRLMHVLTANDEATAYYAKIYSFSDGELIAHINTPANDSKSVNFGRWGKNTGGYIIEREHQGVVVTVTEK